MSTEAGRTWYRGYLQSEHWEEYRNKKAKHHKDKQCQMCFTYATTQLHHKTYEHIGKEWLDDTVFLCEDCHKFIHELKYLDKKRQYRAANKLARSWRSTTGCQKLWHLKDTNPKKFHEKAMKHFKNHRIYRKSMRIKKEYKKEQKMIQLYGERTI